MIISTPPAFTVSVHNIRFHHTQDYVVAIS